MPSLELIKWAPSHDIDKILTKDGVDIDELHTYVEPVIVVAIRNKYFQNVPGNMKRIIYPFRQCKREDFTSRSYIVTELF